MFLEHFLAHPDTWDSFGPLDHGTMFKEAVEKGFLKVENSIQIGIRTHSDFNTGMKVLTAPDVHKLGVEEVIRQVKKRVGDTPCYMTFDIDCLDPAFAPGIFNPYMCKFVFFSF